MSQNGWRVTAALGVVLLLGAVSGCADGDDGPAPGMGAAGLGTMTSVRPVEGAWTFSATPGASTCGGLDLLLEEAGTLEFHQSGMAVSFSGTSPCGTPLADGSGTVLPDGSTILVSERTVIASDDCRLTLESEITGLTDPTGLEIVGGFTLTMTGTGDCGPSLPCEMSGTFAADKCPTAGCPPLECKAPAPE